MVHSYRIFFYRSSIEGSDFRSKCPTTPLFSIFCHFLEFSVSVLHHPVHELLSIGLPLSLVPSIFPSTISLYRELPLRMCPIQFFCLVLIIISIKYPFYSTFFNTSSFSAVEIVVFMVLCFIPADPLHPPPYQHLKSL